MAEDEEIGGHAVVELGHAFWLERFGGDRGIVGRSIDLNRRQFTVLCVMPPASAVTCRRCSRRYTFR